MKKRLIDANALMESKWWDSLKDDFDKARAKIIVQSCPTIDAVGVVHGKWEDEFGGAFVNPRYRCSVCKVRALFRHEQNSLGGWEEVQALTDYCPNCGADMRGETE